MVNKNHADYNIIWIGDDDIFITDLNIGNRSVTNDAERVVNDLVSRYGNKHITYKDTDGQWSELVHDNGKFVSFGETKRHEKEKYDKQTT